MKRTHDFASGRIRVASQAGTGLLLIDNPERKNAVTAAMWRAIPDAVHWLCNEGEARVIVMMGAGSKDFSAGADISEFPTVRKDTATARLYESENSKAFAAIRNARVPVIAAIRGICYGGGFGLAAASDLRIAAEGAAFAVPAARLGLAYPADAMQDFIQSLGAQLARKALYTGAPMGADELFARGFLLEVTAPDALEPAALTLAETIAGNAPLSVQASKLAIRATGQQDEDLMREAEVIGAATFDSADYAEGRAAFAQKRRPQFTGR
ncbi:MULTISPECIES: enoyl-CoA hydratase-related protein [Alphaproteobacteria]|uniref:Enoyl-CoA hydratase n=2 Tax=Alphaproteobacteria TaxID=28211 RepID=A0A512HHK2_9HYPH|nr:MULTISPECIES: enoyl-CoA hydratase-related protein [Alphaproteobacteria]GEO84927.1 enoyl-CoA hydratase [Ciceribacter naphthalenivorans]GLR22861.1 enoyl-CoA hydratase [Ciceribacter naphthalenivorans]GLT05717.1 enoyl-CoA hydratase [Sphingomonas psychrolutea]